MTRTFLTAIAAAAGVALAATSANATIFTLDSVDIAAHEPGDGNGLEVQFINHIPVGGLTFDLAVTDPQTFDLFTIYSTETDVANGEDTVAKPISVGFNFSDPWPNMPGGVNGDTDGIRFLFGAIQYGELKWHDPDGAGPLAAGETTFNWGFENTGLMTVTLSSGKFGAGYINGAHHGYTVKATFDWDNDPIAAPVPEPATWALMIGGFGLAGGALRRRRAVAA